MPQSTIALVEGLDICFGGPANLSRSLGYTGTHNTMQVAEAIAMAAARVRAVGRAKLGIAAYHHDYERGEAALLEMGFRIIIRGSDFATLMRGFRENLRGALQLG